MPWADAGAEAVTRRTDAPATVSERARRPREGRSARGCDQQEPDEDEGDHRKDDEAGAGVPKGDVAAVLRVEDVLRSRVVHADDAADEAEQRDEPDRDDVRRLGWRRAEQVLLCEGLGHGRVVRWRRKAFGELGQRAHELAADRFTPLPLHDACAGDPGWFGRRGDVVGLEAVVRAARGGDGEIRRSAPGDDVVRDAVPARGPGRVAVDRRDDDDAVAGAVPDLVLLDDIVDGADEPDPDALVAPERRLPRDGHAATPGDDVAEERGAPLRRRRDADIERVRKDPDPVVLEERVLDDQVATRVRPREPHRGQRGGVRVQRRVAWVALADIERRVRSPRDVALLDASVVALDGVDPVETDVPDRQIPAGEPLDAVPVEAVLDVAVRRHVLEGYSVRLDLDRVVDLVLSVEDQGVPVGAADRDPRLLLGHDDATLVRPRPDEDDVSRLCSGDRRLDGREVLWDAQEPRLGLRRHRSRKGAQQRSEHEPRERGGWEPARRAPSYAAQQRFLPARRDHAGASPAESGEGVAT